MRWEVVIEGAPEGVRYFPSRRFWRRRSALRWARALNEGAVETEDNATVRWVVRRAR